MTLAAHLLSFLAVLIAPARADEPVKPANRAEGTAIIANARKIVTPNGVEQLEKRRIGGIIRSRPQRWGSFLGLQLAQRHPEWLYAYIGVGQLTRREPDGPSAMRSLFSDRPRKFPQDVFMLTDASGFLLKRAAVLNPLDVLPRRRFSPATPPGAAISQAYSCSCANSRRFL